MARTTPLGLVLALALPLESVAQAPKANPEIAARIDALESALQDPKAPRDADAVAALDALAAAWADASADDRAKSVRAADAALTEGRLRPADQTVVYEAAARALGGMGLHGVRALQRAYERKRFPQKPEWEPMRAALVLNIGRTAEPAMVEFLCERVKRDTEAQVLAAAGEALGHYQDADQKVRKEIAKTLIMKFAGLEGTVSIAVMRADTPQSLEIEDAKRTLAVIADKWNATLGQMTGESFTKAFDWQQWWNDNKGKSWSDRPGGTGGEAGK